MKIARFATAAVLAAVLIATASAASVSVVLNLKDGSGSEELIACTIRHHYTLFQVRRPLHMDGSVQPVPKAGWTVKVKVKRCTRGRFRRVWAGHAKGKSDGTFKITYTPRHRGSFFARAYYYGVRPAARSDKHYFRVR
jgi:hypothetical protein